MNSKRKTIIFISVILLVILIFAVYAIWYALMRNEKIAQNKQCDIALNSPCRSVMMEVPGGNVEPVCVQELCIRQVVPPKLWDLIRGHIVLEGIPERMKVGPYSFKDILFGDYVLMLDASSFNIGATTTLNLLPQQSVSAPPIQLQPMSPPPQSQSSLIFPENPEPIDVWTSATDTPIVFRDFSFILPAGWSGEVYENFGYHILAQNMAGEGFVIDCPPAGKGLEAAQRLFSEERLFAKDDINFSVAFEKWHSSGNDPWLFVWLRAQRYGNETERYNVVCVAQGDDAPDINEAMRMIYETWE